MEPATWWFLGILGGVIAVGVILAIVFRRDDSDAEPRRVRISCSNCLHEWLETFSGDEEGNTIVECPKCHKEHPRKNKNGAIPYQATCERCNRTWTLGIQFWKKDVTITCAHCGWQTMIAIG